MTLPAIHLKPSRLGLLALVSLCTTSWAQESSADWAESFAERVYPLLTQERMGESCVSCHDSDGTSDLVFLDNAHEDYAMLLQEGYLRSSGPDTLLGRVVESAGKNRMPKKQAPWSQEDIDTLRQFVGELEAANIKASDSADEKFPTALLTKFEGNVPSQKDNQFISYRQLRAKIGALFGHGWEKGDRDLFAENIAMFGGADFEQHFHESTQPSSTFLTALDMMARDVVSRAHTQQSGPFATQASTWKAEVDRLYHHFLFRSPTATELDEARLLYESLNRSASELARRDYELAFELTVSDPVSGLSAVDEVRFPVNASSSGGIYQEWVDQSEGNAHTLTRAIPLEKGNHHHRFLLLNDHSIDNVSFSGITLKALDAANTEPIHVSAKASEVSAIGAWKRRGKKGTDLSYEDEGQNKGGSRIEVAIKVPRTALYQLTIHWREDARNASQVFTEVECATSAGRSLGYPTRQDRPPVGLASFYYDSSQDAQAFFTPPGQFQFTSTDGLTVSNADTDDLVTVGALAFLADNGEERFLIDAVEADGHDEWSKFKSKSFGAYNQKGTSLSDEDKEKGTLTLNYRPRVKTGEGWDPGEWYQLHLYYAGKRGHESQVPVSIRATRSSPIIQRPSIVRGHVGARITIDASQSYTTQGSHLDFRWRQTAGPMARFDDRSPQLSLTLPAVEAEASAWQALARALMRHPDFLFTRPPSMSGASSPETTEQLQLVKLAQDLLGRPPHQEELEALHHGSSLEELTDRFLQTKDFEDFYFHRIRLYLESQGSSLQDEPVRLWCHVAFNDRPFQEILTANYTINADGRRQDRPAHHGHTGVLTTAGFIEGKPGLPHYNYAAQVSMLFLGYVYEVPPEIVEQREGITAAGTTDPQSTCYSCHKILTPLALQRTNWTDEGKFLVNDEDGHRVDASDQGLVDDYPFKGFGMEAFATQAVKKERFIRTMIDTHFNFYFGRQMRFREDERSLYRRTWDALHADGFKIRTLIRTLVTSPEYLQSIHP